LGGAEHWAGGATSEPSRFSRLAFVLAVILLAANFFLISPPPGETYPGAIPWADRSVLRPLTELMSLRGWVVSVRGVEVKELVFHLAAAAGLALVAVRTVFTGGSQKRLAVGAAVWAQLLLAGWVLVSLLSSLWSGDARPACGQALIYAVGLAWAVSLAATLDRRHALGVLYASAAISAVAAALCVWYYYERNPYHRPGFPLGNPVTLGAAILPGFIVALMLLAAVLEGWFAGCQAERKSLPAASRGQVPAASHQDGQRTPTRHVRGPVWRWGGPALGALLALVPMVWCLILTQPRGAILALVVSLVAALVARVRREARWVLAVVAAAGLAVGGWWWYSASRLDVTMARGATVRFRLYAWRYAAELWNASSWSRVAGLGAGAYPRLAGAQAVRDRALDPAAFMGEIVEHAHNELFEVLSEIGLVGGVTWVAGMVASVAAGLGLLRRRGNLYQRWMSLALLAALIALLTEALTGSSLRLPGVPAVFFTLLGVLWATAAAPLEPSEATRQQAAPGRRPTTWLTALLILAAAATVGGLGLRNWSGVQAEYMANRAFQESRYEVALEMSRRAEVRLLDPVRVLAARKLALQARCALAYGAVEQWRSAADGRAVDERWSRAVAEARAAFDQALYLSELVPALEYTAGLAARCAEWLTELHAAANPPLAHQWACQTEAAWRRQRERTPYDVETLLALTGYRATIAEQVALLRDALRFGDAQGVWLTVLARLADVPGFEPTLRDFLAAASPITAQTDVDSIVASMAPETYRLAAAWYGLRHEYEAAAAYAARAAELYVSLRPRFPTLVATALAEQADYTLRGAPEQAAETALPLLRRALAELPPIQKHKYDELARPLRFRLALCLLAADRSDEALATVSQALGELVRQEGVVEQVLRRLVQDLATVGLPADRVARIKERLCARLPAVCAGDQPSSNPATTAPAGNTR